jgi:hypothetical protein
MKMLYFSSLSPDLLIKLDQLIELYVPDHALETFQNIEKFKEKLSQPPNDISIVLLAAGKETLKKLQVFQSHLHKLRLVVILPDKDQETLALGKKLQPRFLSYTFGNYSVVRTVLKKHFSNIPPVPPPSNPNKAASRIIKTYHTKGNNGVANNLKMKN